MTPNALISKLSKHIDPSLSQDLVRDFMELRNDCKTGTLGRSSFSKFVETIVQILQFFERSSYDSKPDVDAYLKNLESRTTTLPDDLRICCARIGRSCYTLRNKRNILHKGLVDSNIYDLRYAYSACQWMLSEIVRHTISTDKSLAGKMIDSIQMPVSAVVEDFGDRKMVYGNLTVEEELMILLHSHYPEYIPLKQIQKSMDRRSKSAISGNLSKLWNLKLIHRENAGYKLTQQGFNQAMNLLASLKMAE